MSAHGTYSRYIQGCRCPECSSAAKAYRAEYRGRVKANRSGARNARPANKPETPLLDAAVEKVGQDFPALGALVRQGWTGAA